MSALDPIPVPVNGGAAFFGFMGVSLALVLASTSSLNRFRSRLRNCQGRHGHQQHLDLATSSGHEIADPGGHGRYPGNLRHDRGGHHQPARYPCPYPVKYNEDYTFKNAFSHMASGLVCGFSCIVPLPPLRPPATRSGRWATPASVPTPSRRSCSWG
jgi:hypothetical protein